MADHRRMIEAMIGLSEDKRTKEPGSVEFQCRRDRDRLQGGDCEKWSSTQVYWASAHEEAEHWNMGRDDLNGDGLELPTK